jgi:hypothetical protein
MFVLQERLNGGPAPQNRRNYLTAAGASRGVGYRVFGIWGTDRLDPLQFRLGTSFTVSGILDSVGGNYAMPWKETDVMDLRSQFVEAFESGLFSMTQLCKDFEISRPTGYLWVGRSVKGEPNEMLDLSRAPHTCPHRTPPDVVRDH